MKLEPERNCLGMTDGFLKLTFPCDKMSALHLNCGSLQEIQLNIELNGNGPIRSVDTSVLL